MQLAVARRNEAMDAIADNANSGLLRGYSGTVPSSVEDSIGAATLLFECTLNATAFAAASSGALTANAIAGDASANASGTLSFARIWEDDGTSVFAQLTVGVGTGDLQVLTTTITAGQPINATSLVLTLPVGT